MRMASVGGWLLIGGAWAVAANMTACGSNSDTSDATATTSTTSAGGSGGKSAASSSSASAGGMGGMGTGGMGTGGGGGMAPMACSVAAKGPTRGSAIAVSPDDQTILVVNRDKGTVTVQS